MGKVVSLLIILLATLTQGAVVVSSPDGKIQAELALIKGQAYWSLRNGSEQCLKQGLIGLEIDGRKMTELREISAQRSRHQETIKTVWGKFDHYDNNYRELAWRLQEKRGTQRQIRIIVRVYNHGVGLRYEFPKKGNWGTKIHLTDDLTEFRFTDDYTGWAYRRERDPQGPQPLSQFIGKDKKSLIPLVVKCNQTYLAIMEAASFDIAPFTLQASQADTYCLRASLPESTIDAGGATSWRVVLVGNRPGDLLTSEVLYCLNRPCAIEDTSWIKPGLAMWDWRAWGAKTRDGFAYGLDMASWRRFIDFGSRHNIDYLVLDANWYGPEFDKNSDPRTSRDHLVIQTDNHKPSIIRKPAPKDWKDPIDVPALIKYGRERGVGIILYFNDIARLNYPFDETLALYQKWGAAGIKYGFMKGHGQQKVKDTRKIVAACARHHLVCDFHDGPIPPSGDRRTYPNYMTREFCHSQSDAMRAFSPTGFCEQVFVNMLAGPLDMCNGLYALKNPAQDRPRIFTNVNSTIVAETARVMITFAGISILPDCPESYMDYEDLFAFISHLPMTWNETRILQGEIGKYICTARRSGQQWFVATANNEQARTLEIKLDFLQANQKYNATLYEDSPEAHYQTNRQAYQIKTINVKKGDTIKAAMAPGGGHCIYLSPVK